MAKFKVGEKVLDAKTGIEGTVKARDIQSGDGKTVVKYMVDFGGGIENWKIMSRKQLSKSPKKNQRRELIVKEYSHGEQKLTLVARVRNRIYLSPDVSIGGKMMEIGFSIYNGIDNYKHAFGVKYALHRIKTRPFCRMESNFNGEFNNETVLAIMDAKANYIISHWSEFYRPNNK